MIAQSLRLARILCSILCAAVLAACSNGNDNAPNQASTLGVPGAANPHTVAVPAAEVAGPIAGSPVLVSTFFPLEPLGYEQHEFFISGTANAYVSTQPFDSAGNWSVEPSQQAAYTSRVIVNRPSKDADFNGTVIVEWLNVTPGFDNAPEWGMTHTEMLRSGYAWIGVSVQKVGVDALVDGGAGTVPGNSSTARYQSLHHPGDSYAYDIYSQIAQAIRVPGAVPLLGNLTAQRVIATGESQSAHYLVTYVNAFAPLHALYDGYFIHSRVFSTSGALEGKFTEPSDTIPAVVHVREDLGTPVLMLQTETDLFVLGSYPARQEDSTNFRLWETAGTAHADLYTFIDNRFDTGNNPSVAAILENSSPVPGIIQCSVPVNSGPQHFIANAALAALNRWLAEGVAPAHAARLDVAGEPAAFVLDSLGNVTGGVRTPFVDAPIAKLSGEGQPPLVVDPDNPDISIDTIDFCFLSGTTDLFDASTLGALYTDNADYIDAVNAATDDALAKGYLLPADAQLIKDHAASSDIFAP